MLALRDACIQRLANLSLPRFFSACSGRLTNYLAVQMIFYPIRWRGIPFYRIEGEPLGFLGWQGKMSCVFRQTS